MNPARWRGGRSRPINSPTGRLYVTFAVANSGPLIARRSCRMFAAPLALITGSLLNAAIFPGLPGESILTKVAQNNTRRSGIAYSGLRQYTLRNLRFAMQATMSVHVSYRPGEGKQFTVVERSGSEKLARIIDRLLTWEANASRPSEVGRYDISPENYYARPSGIDFRAGRECYILELLPKRKSKYLLKAKVWVDRGSYDVVRLEGSTAGRLSAWVGQ